MLLHFQYYIDTDIIIFISFSFALFAISFSWVWRRVAQRYVVIDFSVRFPITCQSGIHQVKPHDYFPPILAYLSGFFFFFFFIYSLFILIPYCTILHSSFLAISTSTFHQSVGSSSTFPSLHSSKFYMTLYTFTFFISLFLSVQILLKFSSLHVLRFFHLGFIHQIFYSLYLSVQCVQWREICRAPVTPVFFGD